MKWPLIEYATLREYLGANVKRFCGFIFEGNDANEDLRKEINNDILIKYLSDLNFTQSLKSKQNEMINS